MGSTRDADTRGITRAISGTTRSGTISQRSTLTDFGGDTGRGTFRGDSASPQAPISTRIDVASTNSNYGYYGAYYGGYCAPYSTYSAGLYVGAGFSIGFSTGWYGLGFGVSVGFGHGYGYGAYYGPYAAAYLAGNAWTIQPYYGCWGYYGGSSCYYVPYSCWRGYNTYYYNGCYARCYQPYWTSYPCWYNWYPYSYGYTSLVYDSLYYDDNYDDGYGSGYNRGYEDGAEDATALRDDRNRDSLDKPAGPRPQPTLDRAKASASTEFRHEMKRGNEAMGNGDYAAATKAFKEAAILAPESANARVMLAASAMAERKYAFAAFALRRALTIDAEAGKVDLVDTFGNPETLRSHREGLDAAISGAGDDADLLLLKGFVALRVGDASAAAEALDKSARQNPADDVAKNLLAEAMKALEEK